MNTSNLTKLLALSMTTPAMVACQDKQETPKTGLKPAVSTGKETTQKKDLKQLNAPSPEKADSKKSLTQDLARLDIHIEILKASKEEETEFFKDKMGLKEIPKPKLRGVDGVSKEQEELEAAVEKFETRIKEFDDEIKDVKAQRKAVLEKLNELKEKDKELREADKLGQQGKFFKGANPLDGIRQKSNADRQRFERALAASPHALSVEPKKIA